MTSRKWIASVALVASANGAVVDHSALSILSTSSHARVNTLQIAASSAGRALGIDNTFRFAIWWASLIAGQARTDSLAIDGSALTVRPAR